MTKTGKSLSVRAPLSNEELERLTWQEHLKTKLSEDEMLRLREINKIREQERQMRVESIHAELAPLLAELQASGLPISHVSDLLNMPNVYSEALPTLIEHLQLRYSDIVKETIARALAVPESKAYWPILVNEYRKAPVGWGVKAPNDTKEFKLSAKDGLAVALAAAATDETLPELIALATDSSHGESRVLLLSALKKRRNKNPLAQRAIEKLAKDPGLASEIALWPKKK